MPVEPTRARLAAAIDGVARDVRYGIRGLCRDRTFAATTVSTLAVALALVTVVFVVFNAYVLRPYAVRDPYSLHEIRWRSQGAGGRTFRWSDYQELRSRQDLFDAVIAERNRPVFSDGRPLVAAFVSGNYFETLGGRIRLGRGLADFDVETSGRNPVAILSHRAWTRLFDQDPAALGRELRLNDQTLVVVGIMHEEFWGLNDTPPDLWLPITMHGAVIRQDLVGANQPREVAVIGRLRAGLTAAQVEQALTPLMPRMADRSDAVRAEVLLQATPAPFSLELLAVLSPVFAAFLLVLAAASANVSNVMLARANARHREIGIRLSIGASRGRVVRQLMTEGLLISALAGLAGLALASLVLRTGLAVFFRMLPPSAAGATRIVPLEFDYRVFLFTFVVAGSVTVMFALLPALQATRMTLTHALRGELGRGVRSSTLRSLLVVSQVAVSVVLLVAAATLLRNGASIGSTDPGMDIDGVLSVTQSVSGEHHLIARAASVLALDPRVASIAVTSRNPLLGALPKMPLRASDASEVVATSYMFVSPEYFSVLRIPILRGRGFSEDEGRLETKVAIVSAAAAQALWPGADPLGRTVRVWLEAEGRTDLLVRQDRAGDAEARLRSSDVVVVGVARDVVSGFVYEGRDRAHLYLPTAATAPHGQALLVRARVADDLHAPALQTLLETAESNLLAFDAMPLEESLAIQMFPLTTASLIGLVLSGIALVLSVSGLYGVVTYGLSQRTKEIGIRMALGASSIAVVRLLMTQSARLVAVGAGIGLIVSLGAMATLRAVITLRNVSVLDSGAFAASAAVIAAAAGLATYYPARRAAHIDPAKTLRADG
jgi:predicted permease